MLEENTKKQGTLEEEIPYLLLKSVQCPVCDNKFKMVAVKSGRLRRKEPDLDLRPRFYYIDTLKYDICACPNCGYTAMSRYFDKINGIQKKMIKENVCDKFHAQESLKVDGLRTYDYDTAIDRYKLALYNSIVKKADVSEKAYTCLKISWLLKEQSTLLTEEDEATKAKKAACEKEADERYRQAYDGFVQAISSEEYPICGMDENTLDCLVAAMAYNLKIYDVASKMVSSVMTSRTASSKMKDWAYDLKENVLQAMKKEND